MDWVPVGDFAWYDHILTISLLLGNVLARHQNADSCIDSDTLFSALAVVAVRLAVSQQP